MKVICPISGITYTLSNPLRGHASHPHPVLSDSITIAHLHDWYLATWVRGDLPPVETHLLGIAYLTRLPVASINIAPLDETALARWDSFWAANMESLAKLATKLDGRNRKFRALPQLVVTSDSLLGLPDWIKDMELELLAASAPISNKARELNRQSYAQGVSITGQTIKAYLDPEQIENLVRKALQATKSDYAGLKINANESKALPVILADWAMKVTNFPAQNKMQWQKIIRIAFDSDFINQLLMSSINVDTVRAIETHMQLNTPASAVGSSHSSLLMKRLGEVISVLEDFSPAVSARKKTTESDLIAALDGSTPVAKPAQSNEPKMTLTERLAARLAGIKK